MEKSKLFRKVSLEKLASPERIDRLPHLIEPHSWIALFAFIFLIIVAVIWSIFGSIPTKVSGTAVLLKTGGVINVASHVGGRITDISVNSGDKIKRGDVIARIEQTDLLNEIYAMRRRVKELKEKNEAEKTHRVELQYTLKEKIKIVARD